MRAGVGGAGARAQAQCAGHGPSTRRRALERLGWPGGDRGGLGRERRLGQGKGGRKNGPSPRGKPKPKFEIEV